MTKSRLMFSAMLACGPLVAWTHASQDTPPDAASHSTRIAAEFDAVMRQQAVAALRASRLQNAASLELDDWLVLSEQDAVRWNSAGGFETGRRMGPDECAVVAAGVEPFGWPTVRKRILERAAESASMQLALRSAAAVAPPGELDLLVDVAVALSRKAKLSRTTRALFAAEASRYVSRTAPSPSQCRDALKQTPASLVAPLIAAMVDSSGGSDASVALSRAVACLGTLPAADTLIMTKVSEAAHALQIPVADVDLAPVRRALGAADESLRIEAARVLAALDDVDSIPDLIEAMGERGTSTHRGCVKALEAISGERQLPGADDWRHWYQAALSWKRSRLPELRAGFESGDLGRVNRALLESARHRVFRSELTEFAVEAAKSPSDDTARIAAATLGHLRTRQSIKALIGLLGHESTSVRREAYIALRRATKLDLGEDAIAWERATGGTR